MPRLKKYDTTILRYYAASRKREPYVRNAAISISEIEDIRIAMHYRMTVKKNMPPTPRENVEGTESGLVGNPIV